MTFSEVMYKGILGIYLEKNSIQSGGVFFALVLTGLLISLLAPYFLGSLNFGIIISKYKYNDDIRKYGSGNAGMTNMLRTYGRSAAVLTFIGDALKAIVSVMIGRLLLGENTAYIAGFMCILGHVFPIYYHFQGGKGVVTAAMMILFLNPTVFLVLFVIFALIVLTSKYVSLGSIMGMMLYPILLNRMSGPGFSNIIAIMISALIIFLHRKNIKRIIKGTESKISLKKKVIPPNPEPEPQPQESQLNKNTSKKKMAARKKKK